MSDLAVRPWWRWNALLAIVAAMALLVIVRTGVVQAVEPGTSAWWVVTVALHLPFVVILGFLVGGTIERLGYFRHGRRAALGGVLPDEWPSVCVQLPMFNDGAVAARAIRAACALRWPRGRFEIQVLDDSTEADTRVVIDHLCAELRSAGTDIHVLRRNHRTGYKAGALEAGRHETDAELLVIFDSDFCPSADFLERAVPHFYDDRGNLHDDLALVQAQWGHLNHDESPLTRAQSLWVDDHHTVQMSWRSAKWQFVNFTGTAGVWRSSAVEHAGGWRAASLVEDCELSFRHLFAGYRTTFVKEIVAPAELPATYTAYKAQQRRWTQGWVQLQRLHLVSLLRHRTTPLRKAHLLYHMCISLQWAFWAIWLMMLPVLVATGLWFGAFGTMVGIAVYLLPTTLWLVVSVTVATAQTKHTYGPGRTMGALLARCGRIVPYIAINTGMLPHQFTAFTEGLFGPLHSEFERTPKMATIAGPGHQVTSSSASLATRRQPVKVHGPYLLAEVFFVIYQAIWAVVFAAAGLWFSAVGAIFVAGCVAGLFWFYGDHLGRRLFVLAGRRARS